MTGERVVRGGRACPFCYGCEQGEGDRTMQGRFCRLFYAVRGAFWGWDSVEDEAELVDEFVRKQGQKREEGV